MKHIIYKTTNNKNGKIYIGQHSTNRLNDGYLGSGVFLKEAIGEDGKENFTLEILEFVDGSKEDLDYAEEYYIKLYRDKVGWDMMYNATECARGVDYHTESTRKKISATKKGHHHTKETRQKMSKSKKGNQYCKNRHISEKTRKKISEANTGHPVSEETRQKISAACKNHPSFSKKVLCVETGEIYPCINEASRQIGIACQNISGVCRGINKTAGGYHWKYIYKTI